MRKALEQMAGNGAGDSSASPAWLNNLKIGATIVVSVLAAYGGIQSGINAYRISNLEHESEVNKTFAAAMHEARDQFASSTRGRAMVEAARLWSLAETPQRKLVVLDIVQKTNQIDAMSALATLASVDDDITNPQQKDKPVVNAIDEIYKAQLASIGYSGASSVVTPSPAVVHPGTPRASRKSPPTPEPVRTTAADIPLTLGNSEVAARTRLAAALPILQDTKGWAFIGDGDASLGQRPRSGQSLHPNTVLTNAATVPSKGPLVACADLNIREEPFDDGHLGRLVAVARAGTNMTVTGDAQGFGGVSIIDGKTKITAVWIPVSVPARPEISSVSECKPK